MCGGHYLAQKDLSGATESPAIGSHGLSITVETPLTTRPPVAFRPMTTGMDSSTPHAALVMDKMMDGWVYIFVMEG